MAKKGGKPYSIKVGSEKIKINSDVIDNRFCSVCQKTTKHKNWICTKCGR